METPQEQAISAPEAPQDGLVAEAPPKPTDEQNVLAILQGSMNNLITRLRSYSGSKQQLQRIMMNSAISPLNKEELHFGYAEEKEIFDLYTEVNSAKFMLMVFGLVREGKIQLLKPLMEERELTPSEKQLQEMEAQLGKESAPAQEETGV